MTAQRRRDPRLPGWSIFEDVETVVDGETIRSVPEHTEVEQLIIAANDAELSRRRRVDGRDLDSWILLADEALRARNYRFAATIMRPVVVASLLLTQYDSREPDWYRVNMLARAHRGLRELTREEAVIRVWLTHWPPDRETTNRNRETALRRLATVQKRRRRRGRQHRGSVVPQGPHTQGPAR